MHRLSAAVAVVVTGIALAASSGGTAAAQPIALAPLPSYDAWIADVTPVAAQAKEFVEQRAPQVTKPAVVFDIDNTTLETQYHFHVTRIPALQPSLAVAKAAKTNGAAVFFVTGRPEVLREVSRSNLLAVGYPVDGLYLTDLQDIANLQKYKTAERTAIEALGYTIVANIGNSATDLAGGHAEQTFKLPDYNGALN
ncbi:HAD family acid phosphatase [Antrihabitans cavernicola]|uniref:Phosphatase n=1 Tax=Antrihabitans cavernicola TaxID=2495913 RepID=A0A5A7S500_9NOCA|nr:HAD family acid phosphatase [Spelaeibacter cavernicola]KAA0021248.1 phosphatase [Spelaeibacter cavernicola]